MVWAAPEAREAPGALRLVTDGRSDYQIVVPAKPSFDEQRASRELRTMVNAAVIDSKA